MAVLAGTFSAAALAQHVPDPTRPPAFLSSAGAAPIHSGGPVLQSVLISSGRKVAVISGQTLQVGDRVGDRRVVKIAESEVVLSNGKDLQTLKLFPGIEKRQAAGNPAARMSSRQP